MANLAQQLRIIEQKIKKQIDDSLKKEMAIYVKEEIMSAVSDTIYGAGQPEYYDRRAGNAYGGMKSAYGTESLGDPQEMEHSVSNGRLIVMDTALPKKPESLNMDLTTAIVRGYGDMNHWWNEPRDFIGDAVKNMKETKGFIDVMKWAMQKRMGKDVVK